MLDRTIVLGTIAACMLATPVAAQAPAPTTTAFDGTYTGVSRTLEGIMERSMVGGQTHYCLPNGGGAPALTIVNGNVRTRWGGPAEGSVNAQGVRIVRNQKGNRFDGQIDDKGNITGRWTGSCSYHMVWQKDGK
jgi:hypothetical protein